PALKAHRAREDVAAQGTGAEYFGQTTGGDPPAQLHLPQPILSVHEALRKKEVARGVRVKVRHAPAVANDRHRSFEPGKTHLAFELRQDAPGFAPQGVPVGDIDGHWRLLHRQITKPDRLSTASAPVCRACRP